MAKENKQKVLVVTHSLTRTGAPKVALSIASFISYEFDVSLLNMNVDTPSGYRLAVPSMVEYHEYFKDSILIRAVDFFLRRINKLYSFKKIWFSQLLKKTRPDIVIHNTLYHVDLQDVSNGLGCITIRYLHENYGYLKHLSKKEVQTINAGSLTIGCSQSVVKDATIIGINCYKYFFPATTDEILNEYSNCIPHIPTEIKMISVGSGWDRKGAKYAEAVAEKLFQYEYAWFGDVDDPDLFSHIKYYGSVSRVPYENYTSFLLVSHEEPWSIAVLEALSAGLYIYGWKHLAIIKELVSYGLATAVDSFNTDALSEAILIGPPHDYSIDSARRFLENYTTLKLYGLKLVPLIKKIHASRSCLPSLQ